MDTPPSNASPAAVVDYEAKVFRLRALVTQMEHPDLPLAEFEAKLAEAQSLLADCNAELTRCEALLRNPPGNR